LRSKRQYRNKLQAKLNSRIDVKKKGSRRRKKVIASKKRQLRKLKNQIHDVEHKQTSKLITTLYEDGVQTLVIGDVRAIRKDLDVGSKNNQKLHQWSHGSVRHMLTYKAERRGMDVALQDEHYTSRTCPQCGQRRKSAVQGRTFSCGKCGFCYHRDGVGAINIRAKYCGEFGIPRIVAVMAPASGIRYMPQTGVAREQLRENVCVGNYAEAAGL
jgi:putative transposase